MDGTFCGLVVRGKQLGRTLGFPTANLRADAPVRLKRGVYAAVATARGADYPAIMNIGLHPTLPEGEPTIEVHLMDFSGDLYGERLCVRPVSYLRGEQKFDSVQALVRQLEKDRETARKIIRLP